MSHHKKSKVVAEMKLSVTYSQIAVFDPSLAKPFNSWQPLHVAQGFAWRPGSASFRTLEEAGSIAVTVQLVDKIELVSGTIRAIQVPFSVGTSGTVEIASISDHEQVTIPAGEYALIFETARDEGSMWCRVSFCPKTSVEALVLRADEALSPPSPLLMDTKPA